MKNLNFFPRAGRGHCSDLERDIEEIGRHADGMVSSYCSIIAYYRKVLESTDSTELSPLLTATTTFSNDLAAATNHFQQCLADLSAMCKAMDPVLKSSPDAVVPLMTNFFASFSRQLSCFYADVSTASSLNGQLFQKGAFEMIQRLEPPKGASVQQSLSGVSPPSMTSPTTREGHVDVAASAAGMTAVAGSSGHTSRPPAEDEDEHSSGLATKRKCKKKETPASLICEGDPPFITVSTTVEQALGRGVLMKRPDVFSTLNRGLINKAPELRYFIRFPPSKHLADYVVDNYLTESSVGHEAMASEVLQINPDETEVSLFQSVDGTVLPPASASDYGDLPPCAWRTISNVDRSTRLYTMFMFLQGPPPQGRRILLHEVIISENRQEEVVHDVEAVEGDDGTFACVTVFSSSARYAKSKSAALVRFTRGRNVENNYAEMCEAEVKAKTAKDSFSLDEIQTHLRDAPQEEETFAPTSVQLASLEDPPAEEEDKGFSPFRMSDVAKGAMTVLSAPLTVGKAMMEITGVTDAMRSNMEAALRRACPQLDNQEILDISSCNCAKNGKHSMHGSFYLLTHCMALLSGSEANALILEYDEIKEVKKCRSDRGEAIEVTSHIGERYVFSNLTNRNNSYTVFMKQWLEA